MTIFEFLFFVIGGVMALIGLGYIVGFLVKIIASAIYETRYFYKNKYEKEKEIDPENEKK